MSFLTKALKDKFPMWAFALNPEERLDNKDPLSPPLSTFTEAAKRAEARRAARREARRRERLGNKTNP